MLATALLLATVVGRAPASSDLLFACPRSPDKSWKEVTDRKRALTFIAAANKIGSFAEEGPFDCGLRVKVQCGSDLDGDGVADMVARATWEIRHPEGPDTPALKAERCNARHFAGSSVPLSSLFLVLSDGGGSKIGKVLQLSDETGAGSGDPADVGFVNWKGRPALKVVLKLMHSDTGVTDRRERTYLVEHGELVVVKERPLSPTY
jgi:hypothetical protein